LMISHLHNLAVQVLSEDESNVKALFRRGKAKSELGQTESAREDFLKAKKYLPEDKEILRELRSLAEQDKLLYQNKKSYTKVFLVQGFKQNRRSQTTWFCSGSGSCP
jgi:tetratricopeptide (TPR) repeat protein